MTKLAIFEAAEGDGPSFKDADLTGASFKGAKLPKADFSGAKLVGVDFSGATLTNAVFVGADLSGANLKTADTPPALNSSATPVRAIARRRKSRERLDSVRGEKSIQLSPWRAQRAATHSAIARRDYLPLARAGEAEHALGGGQDHETWLNSGQNTVRY